MSVMEEKPARTRRSFTDEFKRDAVAMVLDEDRRIVDVARSLRVGEGTLGNWVRQARMDRGERAGVTTSKRAELAECAGRTRGCGWNEQLSGLPHEALDAVGLARVLRVYRRLRTHAVADGPSNPRLAARSNSSW